MIKKGDFIELDYTAKLKDEQVVFDTTRLDVAKETGNFNPKFKYSSVTICVGEHQLLHGLDKALEGKSLGKHTIEISADEGFGKKRADLLKLIPLSLFKRDKVDPHPGLDINIDGQVGMVKSVSGGRVIVDFNHPLASKDLIYDVEIKQIVTDNAKKLASILDLIHLPHSNISVSESTGKVTLPGKLPDEVLKALSNDLCRLTGLKEVSFDVVEKKDSHEGHKHN